MRVLPIATAALILATTSHAHETDRQDVRGDLFDCMLTNNVAKLSKGPEATAKLEACEKRLAEHVRKAAEDGDEAAFDGLSDGIASATDSPSPLDVQFAEKWKMRLYIMKAKNTK